MPFELGLAVALEKGGRSHQWFVLESRAHRINKSLSDLNGTDPHIHNGRPDGVLLALTNALSSRVHNPTIEDLRYILRARRGFARNRQEIQRGYIVRGESV